MKIRANQIEIEVEDSGADGSQADRPVVVLVMGLGMQLIAWPPGFVRPLLEAGYRVIRFDNRDIGLSTSFDHLGVPNLLWVMLQHRLGFTPGRALPAARHGRRRTGRARCAGRGTRPCGGCEHGRHDCAAHGAGCPAAGAEPDQHHELQRCARNLPQADAKRAAGLVQPAGQRARATRSWRTT
jgi:hypothetical protein